MNQRTPKSVKRPTIVVLLLTSLSMYPVFTFSAETASEPGKNNSDRAESLSRAFRAAADRVLPAVVTIETSRGPRKTLQWARRDARHRPGRHAEHPGQHDEDHRPEYAPDHNVHGNGSGIITDSGGIVVTNHHVIAEADSITVKLRDGRTFRPADVRSDPRTDLAIIRISADRPLPVVQWGDSDRVRVSDWVVSIGNPFGLGMTVSAGVVGATDRRFPEQHTRLLQTDAACNPGCSGGPLINLKGEVVGISEGSYGSDEAFQGIAFAIPSSEVRPVVRQLVDRGFVKRSWLGCRTVAVTHEVRELLQVPEDQGVIVSSIAPDSPAAAGGLEVGDVIVNFAGATVRRPYEFGRLIERSPGGDRHSLTAIRNGQTVKLDVVLLPLPQAEMDDFGPSHHPKPPPEFIDRRLGMTLDNVSPAEASDLGFPDHVRGTLITSVAPPGPAGRQGLCAGMLVLRIDNRPVRNVAEYEAAMRQVSFDKGILVLVGTPENNRFVVLRRRRLPGRKSAAAPVSEPR